MVSEGLPEKMAVKKILKKDRYDSCLYGENIFFPVKLNS